MAVSVGLVEQLIEKIAPRSWAEEWDNVGLLVGASSQKVEKILLTLDVTSDVIAEAVEKEARLIIGHHPLMFKPLKNLRMDNQAALMPLNLFKNGISFYAAHTNLDQSSLAASATFARILKLEQAEYLEVTSEEKLVKIVTFIPEEHVEQVRQTLAAEGVGAAVTDGVHSENYVDCFYQTKGEGMFRALEGADPAIGRIGELTRVAEIKLESIVAEKSLERAVRALRKAHPYEEPAYDLIPLKNKGKKRGYGLIGYLPEPRTLGEIWEQFLAALKNNADGTGSRIFPDTYDFSAVRLAGDMDKKIEKVAIANGSGSSFVQKAIFKGADLFITGDVDYHGVLESLEAGMAVAELGHFLSEIPMIQSLYEYLSKDKAMQGVEILISSKNKVPWVNRG